ncbi:PTS system beta-glucoside-specific IIA component (Glc family) /PTS system beta-glucoside-specific IIB component (Glc family) /PTS system beta-glucoside-specific IIC component (Glc family) [Scopulibacillus darangshiensis]|uniref:PTS system beta-glucoside-specific IIA component (Glc family) /PTS system beta-glucoside-specific IIB component (Glc family) /PTS system beta-glucoside-specific IIC component (Glc family) n=1 Tax=Scopulibacillus darangshiensis TaxID=442528 RepID=A0A4V2SL04_9BACL|nr:beta-glucoside-specific PTS transporter subunit IIABC [Scopulibacillus darangshiensis]TCP21506.1 PTS system beta-glucoside-specific IIA component (Glc family) /PTS system beta-glucoside-specific IIB component (Glc family) /PTS system beta-glucoside-specific IIC component (Glc family) [Scopulibacillus darangshiensis]
MDNKQLGVKIVGLVGGEANVNSLVHCATRLRFKLSDTSKANKQGLEEIPDVLTVVEKGGQYQVVIGNKVGKVYSEIMNNHNIAAGDSAGISKNEEKIGVMAKIFEYISGTFSPLIPAMAGAGMIKALLAILAIINWIDVDGATYAVLNAASSGFFYFLPIFVGVSAARKLNVNPFIGGAIAAGLLEPHFTALIKHSGDISFMTIPLVPMDYASTVFPMLIAMVVYAPLERFVKRYTPDTIQLFFVPMVGLLIMVPLTALVFGPFADFISSGIAAAVTFLMDKSAILTGVLIASIWPILVVLGVHWGVVPIMISNFSRGGDMIGPITAASTFAQIGIAFGIFLRARKNKDLRSLSFAATLSGLFAGVTEPVLYGLILRYRKLIPLVFIAGAVGGAIVATFNVKVFAFVFNSLFTIPAYTPMLGYIFGVGASFFTATILAFIFGTKGKKKGDSEEAMEEKTPSKAERESKGTYDLKTPLSGDIIQLKDIDDPVFSTGAMGKGVGIEPTEGVVTAPFDGEVVTLFPTKHAIGLVSDDGVELLIHIGLDTVQLDGKHYAAHVEQDTVIKKGDKLITFDIQGIKDEGYKVTTPVIITNTADYLDAIPSASSHVVFDDTILTIVK